MKEVYIRRALEGAIDTLAGTNSIVSSSVAAATVIVCTLPHGLSSGMQVVITGHTGSTPAISGWYVVTVINSTTLSIPVNVSVAGTGGGFSLTSLQNKAFIPPSTLAGITTPYQIVTFQDFNTQNTTMGDDHYRFYDYFQIDLMYPVNQGTVAIDTRIGLIAALFKRGSSFTNGGVTVRIEKTPHAVDYGVDGNFYKKCIRITYWADIFNV